MVKKLILSVFPLALVGIIFADANYIEKPPAPAYDKGCLRPFRWARHIHWLSQQLEIRPINIIAFARVARSQFLVSQAREVGEIGKAGCSNSQAQMVYRNALLYILTERVRISGVGEDSVNERDETKYCISRLRLLLGTH